MVWRCFQGIKTLRLEGKDEHGKFVRDTHTQSDLIRAEGREEIRLARRNGPDKGGL